MTYGPTAQCFTCTHYRSPFARPAGQPGPAGPTCAAFPAGIPTAVLDNSVDHRDPVDGDHGIRWESNGQPFPTWALAAR
jgi:hypothetical protein